MKKSHRLEYGIIFVLLLVILIVSVYTFFLQRGYSKNMMEATAAWDARCADSIHKLVSNKFTRDDFNNINSVEDMQSDRYRELQRELNELRTLNSTRYLYTAKQGPDGNPIYLIDGLDLDASDFAYPGTYIEEEVVPYINAALSGETIYSQKIIDTTWGHIFTACYPVMASDGSGEILGALCMEMDTEDTYAYLEKSRHTTIELAYIACTVSMLLVVVIYLTLRRQNKQEVAQKQLLQETALAAGAANKAKSTFLFNLSHDIRTPMNAILGYAELADRNLNSPDKIKDYNEKIRTCGKKMLSILDNVLELSRIENGRVTLEESAVDAGEFFQDCLLLVQSEADKKHQELTVSKEMEYPYLYFDTTRVTEIILNLVSNAIKYTGEGGRIQCVIRQFPGPKEGWVYQELSVTDNGIGMSEEFQKHIYESFARERSSTVSGIEGTGLGMGIVKKLVDLMQGTIEVRSKLGEGSTFTFRVPCRIASFEETQSKRLDHEADRKKLQGKRILLAEDNDLNAEIAIALLTEEGLIVERAEDGVKCLEMLEKAPSDYYKLVLMDVQMPILNGYDTTQKIRGLMDPVKAAIPIIALTANAFAEDRQKSLDIGMDDHVAKPIDMNRLIPVLEKYLR